MSPPAAKMARMLTAIRRVIARALPALSTARTLFRLIRQFQGRGGSFSGRKLYLSFRPLRGCVAPAISEAGHRPALHPPPFAPYDLINVGSSVVGVWIASFAPEDMFR
jgi:hypothetical protein